MKDLLTDEKFTKKDIITIQDPNNPKAIEMSEFHHLKNNIKVTNNDPLNNINANASTKRILAELNEKKQQRKAEGESVDEKKIIYTSATRGPNTKSSALTSTAMNVGMYLLFPLLTFSVTQERPEDVQRRETEQFKNLQYERIKKRKENAIVTLHTNMGDLNLELYPHWTPKTCDNFISLCERGYYDNTKFHRLIPGFMIQGGDPTGTGKGGESIFKKDFEDEFYQKLKHDSAGVLAMANRGKATNGSQFYITFGACNHLDMKHSIFGKLVGGMDVLREMEQVRTEADRPLTPIIILRTTILKNPYQEDAEEQKAKQNKETVGEKAEMGQWFSNPIEVKEGGIGKYLPKANVQEKKGTKRPVEEVPATETIRQETKKQKFNFSKW
jgi:peptidyl-prolyl cis-trans isomerase-like protein 2